MKSLLTVILLLFVAASVVYLVVAETSSITATADSASAQTAANTDAATADHARSKTRTALEGKGRAPAVIAYYFHGTLRCPTCLTMEEYAREAIEETYATELDDGRIRWGAVNYDEPVNGHFVKEYELVASALVVLSDGGASKNAWRKLERIWDLVGDEEAFKSYVIEEVTNLLRNDS